MRPRVNHLYLYIYFINHILKHEITQKYLLQCNSYAGKRKNIFSFKKKHN